MEETKQTSTYICQSKAAIPIGTCDTLIDRVPPTPGARQGGHPPFSPHPCPRHSLCHFCHSMYLLYMAVCMERIVRDLTKEKGDSSLRRANETSCCTSCPTSPPPKNVRTAILGKNDRKEVAKERSILLMLVTNPFRNPTTVLRFWEGPD